MLAGLVPVLTFPVHVTHFIVNVYDYEVLHEKFQNILSSQSSNWSRKQFNSMDVDRLLPLDCSTQGMTVKK